MGGFTAIYLKDKSQENIDRQNQHLDDLRVPKAYRFYSEKDIEEEYQYYLAGDGVYKECFFPPDKINSLEDFKRYWSPAALGEVFVPHVGSLTLDCYFGRTSEYAMHGIMRWVLLFGEDEAITTSGSYSTLVERSGYYSKTKLAILTKF
jgi:hypothetical protein